MLTHENYLDLVKKINDFNYHYYTLDNPIVEDSEYDFFYDKLIDYENLNPSLISKDSPSQKVGYIVLDHFEKKKHTTPMYSLKKAQTFDELEKFFVDTKKVDPHCSYSIELKIDGLAIILRYENGFFVEARTRGDGSIGEIVTEQVKTIKSIPLSSNCSTTFEVQGEVFMYNSHFKLLNEKIKEDFLAKNNLTEPLDSADNKKLKDMLFKVARNAAGGSLRNLDTKLTAERNLDCFLYNIPYFEDINLVSQESIFNFLSEEKFKTSPNHFTCTTFEEAKEIINSITDERSNLDFDIDGVVIKVNEFSSREKLGYTAKHPRWAIAWKFEASVAETTLKSIKARTNRTGKISFVAELEPFELSGATFKNATLNNVSWMKEKNLINCINATVLVRRSNDVIPEILSIVGSEGETYVPPTHCSSCNSLLVEDGAHLYCKNSDFCPDQMLTKIIHFASRGAMNIEDLSEKTIIQLWENGLIRTQLDLFSLTFDNLISLEGFQDKRSSNIVENIKKSLSSPLENFIYALGIPLVGKETAVNLCNHFITLEKLRDASYSELIEVSLVGENVAHSIIASLVKYRETIDKFIELGINTSYAKETSSTISPLIEDKKFVLTGTISDEYTKDEIKKMITSNNGSVVSSVSKNTDFVIFGEVGTSKYNKALELEKSLNRKLLITFDDFLNMLNT